MEIETSFEEAMEIKVTQPNGKETTYNIQDVLAIDENALLDEFMEQPGTYAWWGAILESERYVLEQAKAELTRAEAYADQSVRDTLKTEGTKITEALVNKKIPNDTFYIAATDRYHVVRRNVGILNRIVAALDQRKDMLSMVGAAQRRDYNASGDLRTMAPKDDGLTVEQLKQKLKEKTQ